MFEIRFLQKSFRIRPPALPRRGGVIKVTA